MPRLPALKTVTNAFLDTLHSNLNLYTAVVELCERSHDSISANPLHANQARRVICLAFLGAVDAWEQYLEAVFVRYLAGATSPSGYRPRPRAGFAQTLDHSYHLVSGDPKFKRGSRYLSWTSPCEVIDRANVFFRDGEPFRGSLSHWMNRLNDAIAIRNRIVHGSQKSRSEFKKVALQHLGRPSNGKLRQGYSVGDLLLEKPRRGFPGLSSPPDHFVAYMKVYLDLVPRITPF